ncbi:SDR family NAD(P)-dependent oxidoreductase [Solitalea lacus]|uniref:SDR family NAD(P)-dependent oxidoreductase n=1 Tax=Solitalea lacus TaxID=2911172 RepID=UPI001EDABD09|nr:SDR family oxidoreductase [Solitalea lacus]UKJ07668.1 SDR family oxidoreductase [Solitalea lacus]
MLLKNKNAVIYGGGGAIGSSIAKAFALEGARVFIAGRRKGPLEEVVSTIKQFHGLVESATVDTLNDNAVEYHLADIYDKAGSIDITVNVTGIYHVQGAPLAVMRMKDFTLPVTTYINSNFITATAAARYMVKQNSGVLFTISTPGALLADGYSGGFGVACAAIEGLTRQLAGELGPYNIRVICLRPDAIPEAALAGSHSREVFLNRAKLMGITLDELLAGMPNGTLLQRSPTLQEIANAAVFLASDKASALTASVANLSCGSVVC